MATEVEHPKPTIDGLLDFYRGVLTSLKMVVDEEGLVSLDLNGSLLPSSVGPKRMVLPTPMFLRDPDWSNFIAFHPLAENAVRGESAIFRKLKGLVNYRLSVVLTTLIMELTDLAIDPASAEKLSPKQKELFSLLPKANEKTFTQFEKVMNACGGDGPNKLLNVYVKRGGKWKGESFAQAAITSFPIREHFNSDDNALFGIRLANKKDMQGFIALFDYLLPKSDPKVEPDFYGYGSRSLVAPRLDALLHTYLKIAKQLNGISYLFRKHLKDYDNVFIPHEWEHTLNRLADYRDLIPALDGNDGEVSVDEQTQQAGPGAVTPVFPAPPEQPQPGAPFQPPAPAGWGPPQANPYPAQGIQQVPGSGYPPGYYPQATPPAIQGQPIPPWQTAPPLTQTNGETKVERTENGLSWQSIMNNKQKAIYGNQPAPGYVPFVAAPAPMPTMPPPGFAGAPYNPMQVMQYQQQQQAAFVPPGGYAQHPRHTPQGVGYSNPMYNGQYPNQGIPFQAQGILNTNPQFAGQGYPPQNAPMGYPPQGQYPQYPQGQVYSGGQPGSHATSGVMGYPGQPAQPAIYPPAQPQQNWQGYSNGPVYPYGV